MGNKDKTRDGDAATDRDHSRDQESRDAMLARTIAEAVALQTQSIAEMFAQQNREAAKETQSIAEAFTRQMEKAHVQYQDLLKETRAATLPTTLSTGQWTRMSTRDGNFGHTRLDSHWRQWKEILRRPRSPTCTIGLMVKAFPKLKDGKTARFSSVRKTMTN